MTRNDTSSDDIGVLRRSIRELTALSTLSAVWSASDPPRIVEGLADVLHRTLGTDFVYVQIRGTPGQPLIETARPSPLPHQLQRIRENLAPLVQLPASEPLPQIQHPLGSGTLQLARFLLGCEGDCGYIVVGASRSQFPTPVDQLLLSVTANQALVALQQKRGELESRLKAHRLRELSAASLAIHSATTTESVLRIATDEARRILNSRQSASSLTANQQWAQAITCVSHSDTDAQSYERGPDRTGFYSLVCSTNRPMRLTQAELEAHPEFSASGRNDATHPPLRGWMAVPYIGRDGSNLGLLWVSDKADGTEFTPNDEAILMQLATFASVAIENARLYDDLRAADRRKDEFLATLAHELRNPLAPLRNSVELLRCVRSETPVIEQVRTIMERQLAQMTRLLEDLLDVSRITRGKLQLRTERVELSAVIQFAEEAIRSLLAAQSHAFSLQLPDEPVYLEADPVRLAQVLVNLLNNASKFTERGGQIQLVAQRLEHEVVISVRDTGIGINPEHLPHIFDMFSQVTPALDRTHGGLGIGLALVKGVVELHRGTIEARSEGIGRGSEFRVRLPVADAPIPPGATGSEGLSSVESPRYGPQCRVLIADDLPDSVESLAMMLRLAGYDTQVAHNGKEAVAMAEQFRPDVALLDIGMPGLNGYEAARQIRQQPWGRDMVLLALTGWGQEEDKRRATEAGFNRHLTKPVEPSALRALLLELVPALRAQPEPGENS